MRESSAGVFVTQIQKLQAAVFYSGDKCGNLADRCCDSTGLTEVDLRLGFYYILTVPYVAGFACFGGPYVGGFRLTGWVFVAMLATAPLVYFVDSTPSRFPIWIWIPWLLMVIFSLTWANVLDLYSLQDVCQILTPFVIAPIASKAMKTANDLNILLRSFFHCLLILIAGLILHLVIGRQVLARPMAMTAAIAGCVFIAQIRERRFLAVLGWCGCLLITGLTGSRMATLALLLEWLILPRYRRQMIRIFAAGLIAALAIVLFYSPVFQERFFPEHGGTLSDVSRGEFSGTGRFEAWPELWKEVNRRPLLGAGAHSSARFVKRAWGGRISKPHNDYLRILLEQGFIGLSVFLFGVVVQLLSLWSRRFSGSNQRAVVRSAAYVGIIVFLLMAMTDNPIVYGVWFMHPLFVLIGASYAPMPEARPGI